MWEDVRPDRSDEHVLGPARLENRLLDPLHVHVQTSLLEWTREGVGGQRLEPGEQGEVAVVELALAQDVCELDRVRVLARRRLLLAVVDTALIENAFDDELEQPVIGRDKAGPRRRRSSFAGQKLSDEWKYLLETVAPGICI